ncbi:isoaspartyl peptidase/L-asparaginase family protein [Phenylobacterium sp. 58.2.17]|uniref:isoaspartyl peptidase/L-asparaginase family protein n=1 Tax=Phenylobacterium sp. 58.2.17 TaxID=2969306 RepID=UPI0022649067|nr:isoaspartyl peptidase/L-asparaginase [Phenylobacterium sp. 58.2.17]MCX7585719.1 isoaspartyl peptidase/L-asparaginase [Phenylobacterium sp. 58.2.17]
MRLLTLAAAIATLMTSQAQAAPPPAPKWAIVVHGGAGVIERSQLTPEQEKAYRAAMTRVTEVGAKVLKDGGSAMDAIEATIHLLEDDPLFNAGRGAVFTAEGRNELDAAMMDGRSLKAGAVAGVTRTRHPISLARAVMEKSPHVMLIGAGADAFSKAQGLEQVDPSYFFTERRWKSLESFLKANNLPIPPKPAGGAPDPAQGLAHDEGKKGTVGVVALDSHGDVAAGTSTGGTTGKRWGRVGDAPIIGAGTYASNASCAVSATGTGEYFIRLTVAREVCALVELKGMSLQAAADQVVQKQLTALGGDGGVIAVAPDGQIAWSYNTSGMYRASAAEGRPLTVGIYKDEP